MNWQKEAINDLRNYRQRKQSLENMAERRAALEDRFKSIRCVATDADPVQGGSSRMEDSLINNIVERDRLYWTMQATQRLVDLTEKGLAGLDDRQRTVLEKFYVDRCPNHVEWLSEHLNYEKSRVYQLKDDALYYFTVSMFGLIDY